MIISCFIVTAYHTIYECMHIPVTSPPATAITSVTPRARSWNPAWSPADLPSPGIRRESPGLSWVWLLFSAGARAGNCWYRLRPYCDSDAIPASIAPTIPASTPGMPCRLWTPHVSCSFRFLNRNGCKHEKRECINHSDHVALTTQISFHIGGRNVTHIPSYHCVLWVH